MKDKNEVTFTAFITAIKHIASTLKILIELERQAYGLDCK